MTLKHLHFSFLKKHKNQKQKSLKQIGGYGIKGRPLKTFKYQFQVDNKIYEGNYKGSSSYKHLKVGNNLLVKFSKENPKKHKIIGYYKPVTKKLK